MMEGNNEFEYRGAEDSKEEVRNLKAVSGNKELGANAESEKTLKKSDEIAREKDKEFIDNYQEKLRLEIRGIDEEFEKYKNKEAELYTNIKNLEDEISSTTVYIPGYDSLSERLNAAKGEFEKNAAELEKLEERKKSILNEITSFYKKMENQIAARKKEFGGAN